MRIENECIFIHMYKFMYTYIHICVYMRIYIFTSIDIGTVYKRRGRKLEVHLQHFHGRQTLVAGTCKQHDSLSKGNLRDWMSLTVDELRGRITAQDH